MDMARSYIIWPLRRRLWEVAGGVDARVVVMLVIDLTGVRSDADADRALASCLCWCRRNVAASRRA